MYYGTIILKLKHNLNQFIRSVNHKTNNQPAVTSNNYRNKSNSEESEECNELNTKYNSIEGIGKDYAYGVTISIDHEGLSYDDNRAKKKPKKGEGGTES